MPARWPQLALLKQQHGIQRVRQVSGAPHRLPARSDEGGLRRRVRVAPGHGKTRPQAGQGGTHAHGAQPNDADAHIRDPYGKMSVTICTMAARTARTSTIRPSLSGDGIRARERTEFAP